MSKTTDNILLVPGEAGWEIWTGSSTGGFTLTTATGVPSPGEIPAIPGGDITLLFPVKSITAVPMRVTSEDDALFADLAALHAERLGLRPDPMAGQLTDVFVVDRQPENTTLLSVLLRSPIEGDLPNRGPKEFDVSARALPLPGDSLGIWKELGRWVFALSKGGNLAYAQATSISSHAPDENLIREIRLAFIQLSIQGIDVLPTNVFLWTSDDESSGKALSDAFRTTVTVTPRPAPVLPDPRSKILPADVRAARRAARKKQNILMGLAAIAVIYLGLIGFFGYGLWKDSSRTKALLTKADAAAPEGVAYAQHVAKWDELSLAIDVANSPVDLLNRIAKCIPPNAGLRLRTADISAGEIKLIGEAPQPAAVSQFSLKLSQANDLANYKWTTPPPNSTNRGWEFNYTGAPPQP